MLHPVKAVKMTIPVLESKQVLVSPEEELEELMDMSRSRGRDEIEELE